MLSFDHILSSTDQIYGNQINFFPGSTLDISLKTCDSPVMNGEYVFRFRPRSVTAIRLVASVGLFLFSCWNVFFILFYDIPRWFVEGLRCEYVDLEKVALDKWSIVFWDER